ncbi:DmpA family aminopeptidase [Tautonia plasticadhaerens]|uniref:Peptidase family S58 n=1 Tax=Tautonia plasticadhaerens TaxID=2527974 RepID=A0A518H4G8_9BACT|nr:P1 family peptidase [Tautonia plasticadhaerens]QDV35723.1 Peptidase family S58 [Tautonia plasticadhaerens]
MSTPLIAPAAMFLLGAVALVRGPVGDDRPRARELGVRPGVFPTGPLNAITDVPGVRVGQVTLIEGDDVRTGVTAILPHGGDLFREKVPGAVFVGNAFGKLAGSTQVRELGTIETPIILTNTLSVGTAVGAVVRYTLDRPGNDDVRSVNALVGETNDGGLNDIRGGHVSVGHVLDAIRNASAGPVAEGSVGAGTGCEAFGWKGGIGTSSRVLPDRLGGWKLGVLVQANFGGVLTIGGTPVGQELGRYAYKDAVGQGEGTDRSGDGSCMVVVATDAPIDARDLERLAARGIFGLARTGSSFSHGSGDFAIAFSTAPGLRVRHGDSAVRSREILPSDAASPLFQAALEATEEAVENAILRASTTTGNGRTVEGIPIDRVRQILRARGITEDRHP